MDRDLAHALRSAPTDPQAMDRLAAALVRVGRLDPVQGHWIRTVAVGRDPRARWPELMASTIVWDLGTEALTAGFLEVARLACGSTPSLSPHAARMLELCRLDLVRGLAPDERTELEALRRAIVEVAGESLSLPAGAALWCLIRASRAVERARSRSLWKSLPGILGCARAALPRGRKNLQIREALVRGVLGSLDPCELRLPPWGTLWVEERPLSGRRRASARAAGACDHPLAEQRRSYRLTLETGRGWQAVTPAIRSCCLAPGAPRRVWLLARSAVGLARFEGLHPVRAEVAYREAVALLGGLRGEDLLAGEALARSAGQPTVLAAAAGGAVPPRAEELWRGAVHAPAPPLPACARLPIEALPGGTSDTGLAEVGASGSLRIARRELRPHWNPWSASDEVPF